MNHEWRELHRITDIDRRTVAATIAEALGLARDAGVSRLSRADVGEIRRVVYRRINSSPFWMPRENADEIEAMITEAAR